MTRRVINLCLLAAVACGCVFGVRQWRMNRVEESQRHAIDRALASASDLSTKFDLVRPAAGLRPETSGQRNDGPCAALTEGPCASGKMPAPLMMPLDATRTAPTIRWLLSLSQGRPFVLMVLFSPTDCPLCLREADVWNVVATAADGSGRPLVQVIGIADKTTTDEMQSVTRDLRLTFPVYVDRDSTLRQKLGVQVTPFKVLVTADGAVEIVDGSRQLVEDQRRFERRVLDIVRRGN